MTADHREGLDEAISAKLVQLTLRRFVDEFLQAVYN